MRRIVIRGCAVAVLTVAGFGAGPLPAAHAATGACISDYSGDELNPVVARSDLLAVTDSSRTYGDILGACATAGATNSITLTMGSVLTSSGYPTVQGDIGIVYEACADINGPIASNIVQIGVDHRGGPVFDGPYPPSQGFKICTWFSIQAATPNDYGMEIYDPDGNLTSFDFPSLPGFPAPVISGNSVTLSMPSTMCFTADAPAPPLVGIQRTYCDPFFNGSSLQNIVVRTKAALRGQAPFPVCVNANPPGLSCNGNQAVGPDFQVICWYPPDPPSPYSVICIYLPDLLMDWAPGRITCSTPGIGCSSAGTPASSPTAAGNGYDPGLTPIPAVTPTCTNPLNPGPSTIPPANNPLVTCGALPYTWNYNPCQAGNSGNGGQDQGNLYTATSKVGAPCPVTSTTLTGEYTTDYGRITPAQLPRILGFTVGPTFLNDNGWNA